MNDYDAPIEIAPTAILCASCGTSIMGSGTGTWGYLVKAVHDHLRKCPARSYEPCICLRDGVGEICGSDSRCPIHGQAKVELENTPI